jgi:hypothetical protein
MKAEAQRRGWKIGAEGFCDWLPERLSRRGNRGKRASERAETDAGWRSGKLSEALAAERWRKIDLAMQTKRHPVKVKIARQLRHETPMSRQWMAPSIENGQRQLCFKPPQPCR